MVTQLCGCTKKPRIVHFKWVNYIAGRLYVDKAVKKKLKGTLLYLILAEGSHSGVPLFKRNSGTEEGAKPARTAGDRGQSGALVQISIQFPGRILTSLKSRPARSKRCERGKQLAPKDAALAREPGLTKWLPCPQDMCHLQLFPEPYRSDTASACSSFRSISRISSSVYSSFTRSSASSLSTACSWAVVLASSTVTESYERRGTFLKTSSD